MYTVDWTSHNTAAWERTFAAAGWLRNCTPQLAVLEVTTRARGRADEVTVQDRCLTARGLQTRHQSACTAQVGSWEGRSAVWLLENLCQAADSRLVCIDTWAGAQQYSGSDLQVWLMPAYLLPLNECKHAFKAGLG